MLNFLRYWIFGSKHRTYYFLALTSAFTSILAAVGGLSIMVSMVAMGLSGYLYFIGYQIEKQKLKTAAEPTLLKEIEQRTVNTGGGNYNETVQGNYIQGDYNINVQGVTINTNQDISKVIDEFKRLLVRLERQGCSSKKAQQNIVDDLAREISEDENIRYKFNEWINSDSANHEVGSSQLAIKFIKLVTDTSSHPFDRSAFVDEFQYGKLRKLLKNGQWEEADEETVRVICSLMPYGSRTHGCTKIDVHQIPPKDLKKINNLWLKYSNGRFGFSEQQNIWRKIGEIYQSENSHPRTRRRTKSYQYGDSHYCAFTECVGWTVEQGRLYHTDFLYSLRAPRGHLPAKIMLQLPSSSNYSYISKCIFEDFMKREYHNIPFIPSWLRAWFITD